MIVKKILIEFLFIYFKELDDFNIKKKLLFKKISDFNI